MTDKLSIYRGAARALGSRRIASLTAGGESKRVFDDIFDDDFIDYVLSQGYWNFATRVVRLEYDASIEPDDGYSRAFIKPDDWIRTSAVCSDEFFRDPLQEYDDTAGHLWSEQEVLFVKYISNGPDYGGDYANWPPYFAKYAQHYMAHEACGRITQSTLSKREIYSLMKQKLKEAKNNDAMDQPARQLPSSNWTKSRGGGRSKYTTRRG